MLFVAGVPPRYINTLIAVSGLVVGLILVDVLFAPPSWQIKLENYQKRRLLVYFGLDGAPRNATPAQKAEARRAQRDYSYNVDQALISVGSGPAAAPCGRYRRKRILPPGPAKSPSMTSPT